MKKIIYIMAFILLSSVVCAQNGEWYNTTSFGNQTTYSGLLEDMNDYTLGWYGTVFLIGFLIVTYLSARAFSVDNKRAFVVASFVSSVIGILMIPLNIVKMEAILLLIVLFVAAFASLFTE